MHRWTPIRANITFLPNSLLPDNEKPPCVLNPMPYPNIYTYQNQHFFNNLTAPNKEFTNIKWTQCLYGHKFIS